MTENLKHTEDTLHKVYGALMVSGLSPDQAGEAIREMQNVGILFRERDEQAVEEDTHAPRWLNAVPDEAARAAFTFNREAIRNAFDD